MLQRLCCVLIGYVLGCILTAEAVSHSVAHKSCSELGTGNPGMANIAHCLGIKWGLLVLAGDLAKTFAACLICFFLMKGMPGYLSILYAGLGCILGHNFPFWHHFNGGKGVAVTCTAVFVCNPLFGLLSCIVGLAVVLASGYLPAGAVVIPAVFTVYAFFRFGFEAGILCLIFTAMMVWRHWEGLMTIKNGTCPKIRPFAFLSKRKKQ